MKTISSLSLFLALAFCGMLNIARAAAPDPLVCVRKVQIPDYNGVFECYHFCEDPHDPDPCPDCCPGGGGGGGGGGGHRAGCSVCGKLTGAGASSGPPRKGGGGGGGGGNPDQCCENEGEQGSAWRGGGGRGGGSHSHEGSPGHSFHGGMAIWSVKEPRLNLFLNDKPFWYHPSRGPEIAFNLNYKNRNGTNGIIGTRQPLIFSVGTNWHTPWRSWLQNNPDNGDTSFFFYPGDGSVTDRIMGIDDPQDGIRFTFDSTNFTAQYNNGQRRTYGPPLDVGGTYLWFLTRIEYPGAITNRFEYLVANGAVRLTKVIDADSRETTFEYTNSTHYSNLISKVIGPFGHTAILTYTNGQLISIKDMLDLPSTMVYSSNGLASFSTPYGTTVFDYYSSSNFTGIRVTEHDLRKHFYLWGDGPTNLFPAAISDYSSLTNFLAGGGITNEHFAITNVYERNTYYWGPRQYANLSSGVRANLDNATFQLADLSTNDFNKGRTRHWLYRKGYGGAPDYISDTLAMEREPSPNSDGSTEGLIIWYDHLTKHYSGREYEGNPKAPKTVAWKFSGTNWHVVNYDRQFNSRVTARKFSHGEPGAVRWQTVTYNLAANNIDVTSVTGGDTENSTRTYNSFHQVITNLNAIGETNVYTYDNLNRLTNATHPNGLITSYTYGADGYVSTVVDRSPSAPLRTNSFTWTNGLAHTHTDERGLTVTNAYDLFGRLVKVSYPDGTYVTSAYTNLHLIASTDRLGYTTHFTNNSFAQVIRVVDALGNTSTNQYCDCGALESVTDPLGNATSYTYDNLGQLTRLSRPGGTWIDYFYDTPGHVIRTADSAGVNLTNYYTIDGHLYTASNAFGRVFLNSEGDYATRSWQSGAQQFSVTCRTNILVDANGVTNLVAYDLLGRVLDRVYQKTLHQADWSDRFVQDKYEYTLGISGPTAMHREVVVAIFATSPPDYMTADRLGDRVEYAYDLLGRKTNEIHIATNGVAILTNKFTYNPAGDMLTLIDGKNQATTWKYDLFGRMTNKVDATSADMFRYAYDANDRLTNRWTPAKGTTKYAYDAVGNLTSIDYPTSTDITLSYDASHRVTNMVDAAGATKYTYEAFGAVSAEDGPWDNDTVSYTYDSGRRACALSVDAPNDTAWSQTYAYDAVGRLTMVTGPSGTFGYDYHTGLSGYSPASLVRRISLPNTSAITNHYDSRGRLLGGWLRNSGGAVLSKCEYILNDLDQRTNAVRADGSFVDYTYDDLGQLKTALAKESGGVTNRWHEQFRYAYDAAGNLTNRIQDRLTNSFTLNSLNQLTGGSRAGKFTVAGTAASATNVTVNGGSAALYLDFTFASTNHSLTDGTNTFTAIGQDTLGRCDTNIATAYLPSTPTFVYDSSGNLTWDGHKALEYDDENQLTQITATNLWKSEFTYDGKMRRRVRREFTWQGSTWVLTNEVRYVYDGNLVLQERDLFNLPQVTYTRGQDLSGALQAAGGIGGLLARTDHRPLITSSGLITDYYHSDGNGNILALIDTNQTLVASYTYDPFGRILSMTGPMADANTYRFSSKETVAGLVYYLYRFYDASLQRWINRDPLQEHGGYNLYTFAQNLPVSHFDPFGLSAMPTGRDPYCVARCGKQNLADTAGCAALAAASLACVLFVPALCAPIGSQLLLANVACFTWAAAKYANCLASCAIRGQCPFPVGPYPGSWPHRI
jgi:RHS repeat-associated protein